MSFLIQKLYKILIYKWDTYKYNVIPYTKTYKVYGITLLIHMQTKVLHKLTKTTFILITASINLFKKT